MEKNFSKIGVTIPEGYWPVRLEMEGNLFMIYLETKPQKWDVRDIQYEPPQINNN